MRGPDTSSLLIRSLKTSPRAATLANDLRAVRGFEFTPAARRRLAKLPLAAATALFEHLMGPVADNPHRLGKPLEAPFDDVWSTRRGEYRALYTMDDYERTITVLAVAHRRDAYRPR